MPSNCTSNLFLFVPLSLQLVLFPHFTFQPTLCYIEPPNLSFLPCISSPLLSLPHVLSWPGIGPSRIGRAETCKAKLRLSKLNTCLTLDFLEVLQSTHMQVSFIVASTFVMVLAVCFCPPSLSFFSSYHLSLSDGVVGWLFSLDLPTGRASDFHELQSSHLISISLSNRLVLPLSTRSLSPP